MFPVSSGAKEVVEITIKVPYGEIAAKWWGRRDVQPILCLHGWQDNAASFDTLIPLLPDHVGYLAFDWPGHGRSSHIPPGMVYGSINDIYILNFIIGHFGWSKVALLAHSLGAITSFIYAACFPHRVGMVVALDGLQPYVYDRVHVDYLVPGMETLRRIDLKNDAGTDQTSYTIEEMVAKMNGATFMSIPTSAALYLLARSTKQCGTVEGRHIWTRDSRLKMYQFPLFTIDINESFAESIECPFLFVQSLQAAFTDPEHREKVISILSARPTFEMASFDGNHHMHLMEPELVSGVVSEFLIKHRSVTMPVESIGSKL